MKIYYEVEDIVDHRGSRFGNFDPELIDQLNIYTFEYKDISILVILSDSGASPEIFRVGLNFTISPNSKEIEQSQINSIIMQKIIKVIYENN